MNARTRILAAATIPAIALGAATACTSSSGNSALLYRLRMCETGGDYRMHVWAGNIEYGGAYGFNVHYWRAMGYRPDPQNASPALQDAVETRIIAQMGVRNTNPGCAAKLGLR